jgi:hypothetical protein
VGGGLAVGGEGDAACAARPGALQHPRPASRPPAATVQPEGRGHGGLPARRVIRRLPAPPPSLSPLRRWLLVRLSLAGAAATRARVAAALPPSAPPFPSAAPPERPELESATAAALHACRSNAALTVREDVHRVVEGGLFRSCIPIDAGTRGGFGLLHQRSVVSGGAATAGRWKIRGKGEEKTRHGGDPRVGKEDRKTAGANDGLGSGQM